MGSTHVGSGWFLAAQGLHAGNAATEDLLVREHVTLVAKLASGFATLAGGDGNAVALVEALREGTAVELFYAGIGADDPPRVVAIATPTGPMDWSDVRMALMLARDALVAVGVLRPSGEQLHAALMGGEVAVPGHRVVRFRGVLRMRADGFNWGRVASERFQRSPIARID